MFIDYLRLTYLIPHKVPELRDKGYWLAVNLHHRAKIWGEVKIEGNTNQSFHVYPDGIRCILDWGGSVLPVDNEDFFRQFAKFGDWTVSRLDIAENLKHCSREQVRAGQSKKVEEWFENQIIDDQESRVWTGTAIGKRASAGSYFRIYDARKHIKGRAAKVARFKTYDFWRVEYELSREFFRRKGIHKFKHLDLEYLDDLWSNETNKKGVFIEGTSEYRDCDQRKIEEVEEDMLQDSRLLSILQMVKKLDLKRVNQLEELIGERKEEIALEGDIENKKTKKRTTRSEDSDLVKRIKEYHTSPEWVPREMEDLEKFDPDDIPF